MTAIEEMSVWNDRSASGSTQIFEEILLLDVSMTSLGARLAQYVTDASCFSQRFASSRASPIAKMWNKMAAELPTITVPDDWWQPIRSNLLQAIDSAHLLEKRSPDAKPFVTYVSR